MADSQTTLRNTLKRSTQAEHSEVDRLISRFDLARREPYIEFLTLHAEVLLPLEQWLEDTGVRTALPDWDDRRRSAALLEDLSRLDVSPPSARHISFDNAPAARIGVLYVLEGSRLGASVLAGRVGRPEEPLPRSFLVHGQGGRLWPTFLHWIEQLQPTGTDALGALEGAKTVFELYRDAATRRLKVEA